MLDGFKLPPEFVEEVFQPLGVRATFKVDEFEHWHRLTSFTSGKCRNHSMEFGAEGGTRTRTRLPSLDPEPSVSTIPPLRPAGGKQTNPLRNRPGATFDDT